MAVAIMPAMGLRGRLVLFFVAIPLVPMALAGTAILLQGQNQLERRSTAELQRAGQAAAAIIAAEGRRVSDLATDLHSREGSANALSAPGAAQGWLNAQDLGGRADVVVLAGADGSLLAVRAADDAGGVDEEIAHRIATVAEPQDAVPGVLLAVRVVPPVGRIAAGAWLDADLLRRAAAPDPGNGAAFVAEGRLLAHIGSEPPDLGELPEPETVGRGEAGGAPARIGVTSLTEEATGLLTPDAVLVLWILRPGGPGLGLPLLALLVVTVVVAGSLGWVLAAGVVAPIRRAADAARAVAGGDLTRRLTPSGGRELEDLAHALNAMTVELAARLNEIESNRDELRKSTSRLGETLSSSLDLDAILSVVVDTAMSMVHADGAALLLLEDETLLTKVDRGADAPARLAVDQGIAGHVLQTGRAVRTPGSRGVPAPAAGEPTAASELAVPLRTRDRIIGLLLLLRRTGEEFDDEDLATIRGFAAQSSVAVENVRLHEETERLSLTNPVTGLWNNRYFELQADVELQRAQRVNEGFAEPKRRVSVMAIDVDNFKRINDVHGHTAGDAALAEVGRRLRDATRAPDVITHLHGEEFAAILPDTDYEGALVVAERMREAVAASPISLPGAAPDGGAVDVVVTCSVGVATFPRHSEGRESLYQTADRAMLRAKARGRNRVVGADDVLDSEPSSG
ncbi:MAG TPA: diguanylate cyclase [Egibacteraceae bacterium]|nr:diguanylate cyclase [Egibacteraceae bacterium]